MKREFVPPRSDWPARLEELGIIYHTANGEPYWNESVAYQFSLAEVTRIEAATNALQELAIAAVEEILAKDRFAEMGIPPLARDLIRSSWNNPDYDELSVFGRFDLAYDGNELKLLEYNADTPTSLPEAAVAQWHWLEETKNGNDQFNSIHERLIRQWKRIGIDELHLACQKNNDEDYGNVRYMGDVAEQAGIESEFIFIEDIGWDRGNSGFVDLNGKPIRNLFKLYPWEWVIRDEFGDRTHAMMRILEPAWKMLLSNKGILAIMWSIAPNHENLLEASFSQLAGAHVSKPTLSREGSNISIFQGGQHLASTDGPYAEGKKVYQRLASIPNMDGHFPVIGSWIVGEAAAGMGIRESDTPITDNLSRFVPHYIG